MKLDVLSNALSFDALFGTHWKSKADFQNSGFSCTPPPPPGEGYRTNRKQKASFSIGYPVVYYFSNLTKLFLNTFHETVEMYSVSGI